MLESQHAKNNHTPSVSGRDPEQTEVNQSDMNVTF
jgi:hypothetical protein